MLSVIEAEEYLEEQDYKSSTKHSVKDKVNLYRDEDQSYIISGDHHQIGYRDIHSTSSKNASRNSQTQFHHQRHPIQPYNSLSNEDIQHQNLLHPTKDKLEMDHDDMYHKKEPNRRRRKKKLNSGLENNAPDPLPSVDKERTGDEDENSYALNNVCNNSNGGVNEISCWDELRKSICPEEAKINPSAAFIEHDIISKQRKEILLLMEELSTRDQELNDLVRSHQAQVKAWEADRNKLKDLQQRLCDYEKELKLSDHHLQNTLEEMRKVTDQKEIDGLELKKTKGEMEKLSKKIQENSFYLKEMEVQNKNLLDSVKKLVNAKEDLEMKGKDMSSRLKTKAGELNLQASEITRLTAQNKTLESKLSDADENIKNLKAESSAWKNRFCMAKDESDRLTDDNRAKDGHIQNLTTQLHETLQQTLALQKALFTSCEREKCKEEIMNSLKKQQKRSMHEMYSLRKLYERQTKELTLYHLSVQNDAGGRCDGGSHGGQGEANGGGEQAEKHLGPPGKGEGRFLRKSLEKAEKPVGNKGGNNGSKHKNEGSNNKNMSYNQYKPNFLQFVSRDESSSFLVKKKVHPLDGQESDSYDERRNFIYSIKSDDIQEIALANSQEHGLNAQSKRDLTELRNDDIALNKKGKDKEEEETQDMSLSRSRNLSRLNGEMEKNKRRSKSLGVENQTAMKNVDHHRPNSCSRGTSPFNIQDTDVVFYTSHKNTGSLNSDVYISNDDKKVSESTCKKGDNLQVEMKAEEVKRIKEKYQEVVDNDRVVWPKVKQMQHNETSGVYLSSSDCSSGSTLSSPGREKIFDELTPADSDGMCNELQRRFLDKRDSGRIFRGSHDLKTNSIHLRNSPTVVSDVQNKTSSVNTKGISIQRDGDDSGASKRNVYVPRSYRLVDDKHNEDSTIQKEKWSESSDMPNSSLGVCTRSEEVKDGQRNHVLQQFSQRTDLSSSHNDMYAVNRGKSDMDTHPGSNSMENDSNSSCINNNQLHSNPKELPDSKEPRCVNGASFLCNNSNDHGSRFTQAHNPISQCNKGEGRKFFSLERNDREKQGLDNQNGNYNMRRLASSGRCVRVVSPHQDVPNKKIAFSNDWKKDAINHINTRSDCSSSDSDQSEMSLLSLSTRSNRSSLKEKVDNIVARSSAAIGSCKSILQSAQHKGEADSKIADDNKGETKDSHMDKQQHYFYEENLTSDSDHHERLKEINRGFLDRAENSAYIVPVSSSTCSRPFTSTKAPSLYKKLSNIHFSEKSRRYEWANPSSYQDSEDGENQQKASHHQGKQTFVSFPNSDIIDENNSCSNNNNDDNNNNNSEPLQRDHNMVDIFEDSSQYIDSPIVHPQGPNTNMDKFHHHYNNIVRKLSFSNIAVSMDDNNVENSIIAQQYQLPANPVAPEKLKKVGSKLSECSKTKWDESIFSPGQICVTVCDSKNNSALDDNVVQKLDFSNSTCVDQSVLDIEAIYTSHFSNGQGVNSQDKFDANHKDKDSEKLNIQLNHKMVANDYNSCTYNKRHEKYLQDIDSEINHLDGTDERNKQFPNIVHYSNSESFLNVCGGELKTGYEKGNNTLSGRDDLFKSCENTSDQLHNSQKENKGEIEFVASLPDYFPDISSVIADEDSVNVGDLVGRDGRGGLNDFIEENTGVKPKYDRSFSFDSDGDVSPQSIENQPYSHTSTPTKLKTKSTVSYCHSTNDLNSPYQEKDRRDKHKMEEKTLTSMEAFQFSSVNEANLGSDKVIFSVEIGDDGDGMKKNIKNTHIFKSEKATSGNILDMNNIGLNVNDKEDQGIKIYSEHRDTANKMLVKSPDRSENNQGKLLSPILTKTKIEKYRMISYQCKDKIEIANESSKLTPLEVKCIGYEEDDSSYLEGPWDKFEDRLSNYLSNTPRQETSEDLSTASMVPMSPASKLHHLLVESQEMIRSLEKKAPLQ